MAGIVLMIYLGLIISFSMFARAFQENLVGCLSMSRVTRRSLNITFETVRLREPTTNRSTYDLRANFAWEPPPKNDYDVFLIRLVRDDQRINSSKCSVDDSYMTSIGHHYTFRHLIHGYQYLFQVATGNSTTNQRSLDVQKWTKSPDCYIETQDRAYCASRSIQTIGIPIDLHLVQITKYRSEENMVARVAWYGPVQINGTLSAFYIMVSDDESEFFSEMVNVETGIAHGPDSEFVRDISNIQEGKSVSVKIHCFVSQGSKHFMFPGPASTIVFNATPTDYVPTSVPGPLKQLKEFFESLRPNTEDPLPEDGSTTILTPTLNVTYFGYEDNLNGTSPVSTTTEQTHAFSTMPTFAAPASGTEIDARYKALLYAGIPALVLATATALILLRIRRRRKSTSNDKTLFIRYPDNNVLHKSPCQTVKDQSVAEPKAVDLGFEGAEFDRSLLHIDDELGAGQFGIVYKAFALGLNGHKEYVPVAVKSLKASATVAMKEDFLNEMRMMLDLGSHPNILPVIGCCTREEPYYLITEFIAYGDLLHFLWKCREEKFREEDNIYNLTEINQLQIAHQIARGMEFISKSRFFHGDLAARNVLVGAGLQVKISDFGMADDIYQSGYKRLTPDKKRPVKWVSLETNTIGRCTIQSDVWSFGVVLYEIYTLGGTPYPGMDGREVIAKIQEGYRMEKPIHCPEQIYAIMRLCWHANPCDRPTFSSLFKRLDEMLATYSDYMDNLTAEGDEQRVGQAVAPSLGSGLLAVSGRELGTVDTSQTAEGGDKAEGVMDAVAMDTRAMETNIGQDNEGFLLQDEMEEEEEEEEEKNEVEDKEMEKEEKEGTEKNEEVEKEI